jgi:flavodoxin/Fe-S-cluster-containing hydrogenase component 2
MKCAIVYFSQTGNTEQIARAIHKGASAVSDQCDLLKLKDVNPGKLYDYDLLGLGTPCFGYVEPDNVRIFIHALRSVGGKHFFVFFTHGAEPDEFLSSIVPRLSQKGAVVIGAGDWYGSCYLPVEQCPYPTDGHPDDIDLAEAEAFGREMVQRSQRITAGETDLIPPVPDRLPELTVTEDVSLEDLSFRNKVKYHKELCRYPKCRLCVDNCPMDGIDLSVDPPVLCDPCLGCIFCARICPTGAMDGDAWVADVAPKVSGLMAANKIPALRKAEAAGKFRRHVPEDEIGYDTPIYKIYTKHPQWIIGKGFGKSGDE